MISFHIKNTTPLPFSLYSLSLYVVSRGVSVCVCMERVMRFGIICIVTCCFCCFASWIISIGLKAWLPNEIVPRTHKTPKLRTHRENMLCCVNVCNALKRWLVNANKKCWRLCSFFSVASLLLYGEREIAWNQEELSLAIVFLVAVVSWSLLLLLFLTFFFFIHPYDEIIVSSAHDFPY